MPSFTDVAGREWSVSLHGDAIRQIRAEAVVDRLANDKPETISRLVDDPCHLVQVLWCVVAEQAERDGISPEQFGRALAGAAVEQATEALLEALCCFFPPRRAGLLRNLLEKLKRVQTLQLEQAEAELAGLDELQLAEQAALQIRGG